MKRVMHDLETLGTVPGCVILSIGAVRFDPRTGELGSEFYSVISTPMSVDLGLHIDPRTEKWWLDQSPEARKVLEQAKDPSALGPRAVLAAFNGWLAEVPDTLVYGNGADFDNALMAAAYHITGVKPGWAPYNGRCYRTLKQERPDVKLERTGTHHNALQDAICQARHLLRLADLCNLKLN